MALGKKLTWLAAQAKGTCATEVSAVPLQYSRPVVALGKLLMV